MENWGLLTYRETALLYDPANSGVRDQRVCLLFRFPLPFFFWFCANFPFGVVLTLPCGTQLST
jgi:hypothetical protein